MNPIQDERILSQRRAIQSRAYLGVIYALALSILVQQFLLHAPFEQYAVEFLVLLGCGLHNLLSHIHLGINLWNPTGAGRKSLLLQTLASCALSVLLLMLLGGERSWADLALFFITFAAVSVALRLLTDHIAARKQRAIDRELDDEP